MERQSDLPPSQRDRDRIRRGSLLPGAPPARPLHVFEEHRRHAARFAHVLDHFCECVREPAAFGGRDALQRFDDPLLGNGRGFVGNRASALAQIQNEAARVPLVAIASHVTAIHEARDNDGNRALIGARSLGELGERRRGGLSQLVQDEQLCARQSELALRGAIGQPKQTHQTADGIQNSLAVSQNGSVDYQTLRYASGRMAKKYDHAYFDRWYRGRIRIGPEPEVRRKVTLAVAATEYFLRRTIQNVLDIGCGEAPWFTHLQVLRPKVRYAGYDPSDYIVQHFGESRNVRHGSFGELASLNIREKFDLVVCADVLHYLHDDEIRRGLPALVRLIRGAAFQEVLTYED